MTGLGFEVACLMGVPDRTQAIEKAILRCLGDGGRGTLVFTSGGLGATPDDRTLEGVASAAGVSLVETAESRGRVLRRYREVRERLGVPGEPPEDAVDKLSLFPRGARLVPNAVGVSPGTIVPCGTGWVISLPGTPSEVRAIFSNPVTADFLGSLGGAGGYREVTVRTDARIETDFSQVIARLNGRFGDVLVKPRPKRFESDVRCLVRLAVWAETFDEASARLQKALAEFRRECAGVGIAVGEASDT
jgi:molybdopterin-biosynthesis enzyme MoeA-like protein